MATSAQSSLLGHFSALRDPLSFWLPDCSLALWIALEAKPPGR